jgi:secondary thiamine-phosphate synthase enzyme
MFMAYFAEIRLDTRPDKFYNITTEVQRIVRDANAGDGICLVYCPGSTGAVILNEDDPMLLEDLKKVINKLVPFDNIYMHADNAQSHIRAALFGPGKTIPIKEGKLMLGQWQSVLFYEADSTARSRNIIIAVY